MQLYAPSPAWTVLTIMLAFALVQATMQIGASVLTLLNGYSLGRQRSLKRLFILNLAYIAGNVAMLMLVFGALLYVVINTINTIGPYDWWLLVGLPIILAAVVLIGYYRLGRGTVLWLPRIAASYLTDRAKRTRNVVEAAMLGSAATLFELPFTIIPMIATVYIMIAFVIPSDHFAVISIYSLIVVAPLIVIAVLVSGGHRLSTIQRWREDNKRFMQIATAAALVATALFVQAFYGRSTI
ncbi:MAG: hypothetical protein WBB39_02060 [Candidatus Saccharimonadales bacterium]